MQIGAGILKKWAFECSGLAWFCQWKLRWPHGLLRLWQSAEHTLSTRPHVHILLTT